MLFQRVELLNNYLFKFFIFGNSVLSKTLMLGHKPVQVVLCQKYHVCIQFRIFLLSFGVKELFLFCSVFVDLFLHSCPWISIFLDLFIQNVLCLLMSNSPFRKGKFSWEQFFLFFIEESGLFGYPLLIFSKFSSLCWRQIFLLNINECVLFVKEFHFLCIKLGSRSKRLSHFPIDRAFNSSELFRFFVKGDLRGKVLFLHLIEDDSLGFQTISQFLVVLSSKFNCLI